ncbi:MAG TPA: thioredoxin-disulfide reductase [Candidatus Omnitrophica bacterium]|nr:thioredoxin-disulfide reductase [Candidatus Omnitrophota bacterium]
MIYDVAIIGGGPAGLTAAIYAGRSQLKTKVVEKLSVGGQLLLTELIENFPGVYQMNSHGWINMVKKQLSELDSVDLQEDCIVEKIEYVAGSFRVCTISQVDNSREIFDSHSVIVATGALPKRLGIKGEDAFIGRGVSFCATCDGPFFKDKAIALVGGGDTALEEALYLRRFARKITIIHRRDNLRATAILQERCMKDEKIEFRLSASPVEILGNNKVEGIKIKDLKTHQEEVLACDGVFVFIGFTPDTVFLRGLLDLNDRGYILTDEHMMSSCQGIFAAGDCRHRPFNQVVTACSDGAVAAYSATKFLEKKKI